MADAFDDFLDRPSTETFLRLRDNVLAAPGYDFYSDGLDELEDLAGADDHAGVLDALPTLMPNWLLSPRVHRLAGVAARQAGDEDRALTEESLARACMTGLLRSGAGTKEKPFRVLHVSDEYDAVEALGKTAAGQRQVVDDDGVYDVLTCADGSELWFDVSASLAPVL
jgi:hypothetical protein